jgi:hypothetical protein
MVMGIIAGALFALALGAHGLSMLWDEMWAWDRMAEVWNDCTAETAYLKRTLLHLEQTLERRG